MSDNENRKPKTDPEHKRHETWQRGAFDHEKLDAFRVAKEALRQGHALSRSLPRGYGKLQDQLLRALLGSYLQMAEAASRAGRDRVARYRMARGEASEAAAALEAVVVLDLLPAAQVEPMVHLLGRLCAMLTRLGGFGR